MDFRGRIREIGRGKNAILEIGPSYNPIVTKSAGFPVVTLDHATKDELLVKYRGLGVDPDHLALIEDVDFITTDVGSLKDSGHRFDLIVASHVVEHTTDLITFINSCSDLLSDDGQLALIIPDKANCFDAFRPLTSPGAVIDAHRAGRERHAGSVFDQFTYQCVNGDSQGPWSADNEFQPRLVHTREQTAQAFHTAVNEDEYFDCHAWVFTPSSFQFLIGELRAAHMIDLGVDEFSDTMGFEFFAVLAKNPAMETRDRLALMRAMELEGSPTLRREIESLRFQLASRPAQGWNRMATAIASSRLRRAPRALLRRARRWIRGGAPTP